MVKGGSGVSDMHLVVSCPDCPTLTVPPVKQKFLARWHYRVASINYGMKLLTLQPDYFNIIRFPSN